MIADPRADDCSAFRDFLTESVIVEREAITTYQLQLSKLIDFAQKMLAIYSTVGNRCFNTKAASDYADFLKRLIAEYQKTVDALAILDDLIAFMDEHDCESNPHVYLQEAKADYNKYLDLTKTMFTAGYLWMNYYGSTLRETYDRSCMKGSEPDNPFPSGANKNPDCVLRVRKMLTQLFETETGLLATIDSMIRQWSSMHDSVVAALAAHCAAGNTSCATQYCTFLNTLMTHTSGFYEAFRTSIRQINTVLITVDCSQAGWEDIVGTMEEHVKEIIESIGGTKYQQMLADKAALDAIIAGGCPLVIPD